MSQTHEQPSRFPGALSASPSPPIYVGTIGLLLLGTYLFASILIEIILIVEFWPRLLPITDSAIQETPLKPEGIWYKEYCLLFVSEKCCLSIGDGTVTDEQRLIVLVLLAGAIGGMVHTLRSYVAFAGNRLLTRSWIWWYIFRPAEGAILALVFYLVVQGGLTEDISRDTGIFGVVGVSALVGMFSEQAVTKLKEVADTIFTRPKNEGSVDKLPEKAKDRKKKKPKIESLNPSAINVGSESAAINIIGAGFTLYSVARVEGHERSTVYISEKELTCTLDSSDVAVSGEKMIDVWDSVSGAASNAIGLKIS